MRVKTEEPPEFESETVLFDDIRGSGFYNYGRKVADISGDYVLKVKG